MGEPRSRLQVQEPLFTGARHLAEIFARYEGDVGFCEETPMTSVGGRADGELVAMVLVGESRNCISRKGPLPLPPALLLPPPSLPAPGEIGAASTLTAIACAVEVVVGGGATLVVRDALARAELPSEVSAGK